MAAPVEKGDVLAGKYRVERVLGEGGMGVVVAATDTQLERHVAIKFLLPEYSEHTEAAERFMREARAAVRIKSEHIARVIDVSEMDNGSPYMVMEYLEGADLSDVLEQRGPLPVEEAVDYVIQACDAIAEAHSYGIVHRDLKPANLFLAQQPGGSAKIKVLDFGISKTTMGAQADASLTRTSSMMGSPLYMSPEQMRSTKDVDWRTDIWALGVILYELLSGKLPFDAASIPELSAKILLEPAEPLNREDVPKALKHAIERTLAKKPGERFPTVAEFSMAIATFGSKRSRQNVERISKILSAAGMSTSQLQLPPTVPPAAPGTLDETRLTLDDIPLDTSEMKREHSSTVSQWGRTNGPAPQPRKSGAGLWVAAGVLVVGVVGAGAFFLLGNSESATANVAAQPTVEPVASPEPDPTLEAPAAEATASAQAEEAANDDGEAAADADETNVEPSATATQTAAPKPTVKKAVPKKSVPRPTPRPVAKPAPKPKSTQPKSQKNKFGSRK